MHFCRKIFSCPTFSRNAEILRAGECDPDSAEGLDAYIRASNYLFVFCRGRDWERCPFLNNGE